MPTKPETVKTRFFAPSNSYPVSDPQHLNQALGTENAVDGVHHYDEYGLANINDEPPEILKIHKEMIHFVKEWLKDWDNVRVASQAQ